MLSPLIVPIMPSKLSNPPILPHEIKSLSIHLLGAILVDAPEEENFNEKRITIL